MCYRLFISSDQALPCVPATNPPGFSVTNMNASADVVLPFPQAWFISELGSTSGCACNFHGLPMFSSHEDEEVSYAEILASLRALVAYLCPLVERQKLLIYSTWYGEEHDPHIIQTPLTPNQIIPARDPFPQQTLTAIIPN